ncbi:MAG: macro domain-containing protein [Candidatus Omnitrophica bacterium]|nr:macro domain-containing protein [Candidatus Omnitrophota bacterium]
MPKTSFFIAGTRVTVKEGNIAEEQVDAIVNAANNRMIMGGGVALAIKRAGGDVIEKLAMEKAPVRVGEAVHTRGGKLPAEYVIHAATMGMDFRTDAEKVRKSAASALLTANTLKISSIAFPALGCGTGGLSPGMVADIMIEETLRCLSAKGTLNDIRFVLYDRKTFNVFFTQVEKYLVNMTRKTYRNPVPTVDIIIEMDGGIVLVKRKNYPYGWAIPGGFVDYGESLEDAAVREAKEETGLDVAGLEQFHTYSEPGRDPRHHTISTVFTGRGGGELKADDDAEEAKIFSKDNLPSDFAFDHGEIVKEYFQKKENLK